MISHSASFTNFNGLNTTLLPKLKRFSLITNQTDSIPCCHLNKYNCFCTDDEALEGDWDMYMDGARSSRCISNAAARPSHPIGHDDSAEHTSHAQARPQSPLSTRLSPPLFSGSAHKGGYIFVPTPSRLTPPVVQANPTQEPSLPNPDKPTAQIDQIRSENIEPVHGLRRSLRTDIHPPCCRTGDGKYHAFLVNFFQIYLIKQ